MGRKKNNRKLKSIVGTIHLWLGLVSGIIVFIIAITGCFYAFQSELRDLTEPYRFVEVENKAILPPSTFEKIAHETLPGKHLHGINYPGADKAVEIIYYDFAPNYHYYYVFANPYSGKVLKVKNMEEDFFQFILDGHFYLWLPPEIGQPVVAYSTLIFVTMLITGIVLWWPKNKSAAKQRFSIKWSARWRRKNYDLHNVLGFYSYFIALILALTGLVWGFQWFAQGSYKALGGEKSITYLEPQSDTTKIATLTASVDVPAIDKIWFKMLDEYPNAQSVEVHVPESKTGPIAANANPDAGTYWQVDYRYFDQYTLEEISVDHIYGRQANLDTSDKIFRMNYDIHTGAILGFAGKILAFFASLIVASLPITGFYIWYGRRKKKKSDKDSSPMQSNKKTQSAKKSIKPKKDVRVSQEVTS